MAPFRSRRSRAASKELKTSNFEPSAVRYTTSLPSALAQMEIVNG